MATPTLAKSPLSDRPYDGKLIEDLIRTVEKVEKPKPPQPARPLTDEDRQGNAANLLDPDKSADEEEIA